MKKFFIIGMVITTMFAVFMTRPSQSEAWHRGSSFFVAAGPSFYGFPMGLSYTTFSRRSAFSIGLYGFWPGYYYPYYAPVYHAAPVYYEPVYYGKKYYRRCYNSWDDFRYERRFHRSRVDNSKWVKDAEEFLRGGGNSLTD